MATIETRNTHEKEELLTRWYKQNYDQCKDAIITLSKKLNLKVVNINDNYAEILLDSDNFSYLFDIYTINPVKSSIDICITSKGFFKKPIKQIELIYSELNKSLTFIKKGSE